MIQTLIGREPDLEYIRRAVAQGACCSIVGTSNLGKSALLRHLGAESAGSPGAFIYIDCNQMADRTARSFFAVTWRALAARLENGQLSADALTPVRRWSAQVIHSLSPLAAQSAFEDGLAFALGQLPQPLVLCLDEFDQVYQQCEPQTFLNLRALRDRYGSDLGYVTATERELANLTTTREQGEFLELVAGHVHFLSFWSLDDSCHFCAELAVRAGYTFDHSDYEFIYDNAGGHPGLTQAVCEALGPVTGAPARGKQQNRLIHQVVQASLSADEPVRSECGKIWEDLEPDERAALLALPRGELSAAAWRGLNAKCILKGEQAEPLFFGRLFADFVRQQKVRAQPNGHGVYVDVDAGRVWVDGSEIEGLSELEYKLLLFLYGRLDRVCDKYAIVEGVWGQDYIDQVDDARIEKLVSRVRQKIEPDPAHPRYLLSLRGRGYRLTR